MNLFLPNEDPASEDSFGNDHDDKIQRILNEKKRKALAARYGVFWGDTDPTLSADIDPLPTDSDAKWLWYSGEFDQQFEGPRRVSVREYLGNPKVLPLAQIPPDDLEEELANLVEFMYLSGVAMHFLCEIAEAEAYRFIVNELFDEKVDEARSPGMTTNFIYEEFYPNDAHDAKIWAQDFLYSLFDHHREGVEVAFCPNELYTIAGARTTVCGMMARVDAFFERHPMIIESQIKPLTCTIDGDYATVHIATTWTSVRTDPADQWTYVGRSTFRLKRSKYDGWDIMQAIVAGWDSPVQTAVGHR